MSFKMRDSAVRDRGAMIELNEDVYAGFKQAVQNNQTRLALEYAVQIIDRQKESIESLTTRIGELDSLPVMPGAVPVLEEEIVEPEPPAPVAKKAASRKVGGKKPTVVNVETTDDSEEDANAAEDTD